MSMVQDRCQTIWGHHAHTHTHIHTSMCSCPSQFRVARFWEVGGNRRTQKNPTQAAKLACWHEQSPSRTFTPNHTALCFSIELRNSRMEFHCYCHVRVKSQKARGDLLLLQCKLNTRGQVREKSTSSVLVRYSVHTVIITRAMLLGTCSTSAHKPCQKATQSMKKKDIRTIVQL